MTWKNVFLNLLIGLGLVGFIIGVAALEVIPFWVAIIIAAVLWIIFIVLELRDQEREKRYPVLRYQPSQKTPKTTQTIYDQEADNG